MTGSVALLGGMEHTDGCQSIDRWLLDHSGVATPEVAVLLAASPSRRRAFKVDEATRWWAGLGARARCAWAGEPDPVGRALDLIVQADLVVLTGGRPWLAARRLADGPVAAALRTASQAGVPILGSSAGAMVAAAAMWSFAPGRLMAPRPALGLAPGVLVAPHSGRHGVDEWGAMTQTTHPHLDVIGIPDHTALVVGEGSETVMGLGRLQRYERTTIPVRVEELAATA